MADKTFIVHSDWLENIKGLPLDQQDKVIAEIVRYGTEMDMQYLDDPIVQMAVNFVKGRIDFSKDKYAAKIDGGLSSSRKRVDNKAVYELAQSGKSSAEIAAILGCSKSTIDHCDGWKHRTEPAFF